ncbi:MAG: amidohydrolase family protein [Acidobacteria bacterium]|nr:amidohydrolase family protein [Acidobacteriota bacterium]
MLRGLLRPLRLDALLLGVFLLAATAVGPFRALLDGQSLTVEEWTPKSTLVVEEHLVPRAKYPVIDVHSHHRPYDDARLKQLLSEMDALNLRVLVNLSGGSGDRLKSVVEAFPKRHPKRFVVFANVDFSDVGSKDFPEKAAARLEEDIRNGAVGLKFFKNFGMDVNYPDGRRMPVDDPAMDKVFEVCAKHGIPVLIHVADPAPFWQPMDQYNEKWLELKLRPGRKKTAPPSFEELIAERNRLVARHPKVNFILAHMGWHGGNLKLLGKLFDENPNVHVDIAAVLYELGRVPFSGREFFIKYSDRILFGKDSWAPDEFPYYWRVFETRDEYFDYYRRYHAHWQLYGLDLPDDVLKKVYYKNALRLIRGIDPSGFPE